MQNSRRYVEIHNSTVVVALTAIRVLILVRTCCRIRNRWRWIPLSNIKHQINWRKGSSGCSSKIPTSNWLPEILCLLERCWQTSTRLPIWSSLQRCNANVRCSRKCRWMVSIAVYAAACWSNQSCRIFHLHLYYFLVLTARIGTKKSPTKVHQRNRENKHCEQLTIVAID